MLTPELPFFSSQGFVHPVLLLGQRFDQWRDLLCDVISRRA